MKELKNNQYVGKIGEDMACDFLIKKKYIILFRNYHQGFDEIDIIARSFDRVLVFVEVKTLRYFPELMPEDHLTKTKFKRMSRAGRLFAGFHKELICGDGGWRIDLIAVTLGEEGDSTISHYENITA
jgi:putative endonuclease